MAKFLWTTIAVDNEVDAAKVIQAIKEIQMLVPSLDVDEDWIMDEEEDEDDGEEQLQCPVCNVMVHMDAPNCTVCGANMRLDSEG